MLTEKGSLPIGVEIDGQLHKAFEIRPQKVRDTVDQFDDPDRAGRCMKNSQYFAAALFAGRLLSLGSIPKDEITPELILDLEPEDYEAIQIASGRLEERMASFRGTAAVDAQGAAGASETGDDAG